MMKNGLLHNPPEVIEKGFEKLFLDIESCLYSANKLNRFKLSESILESLRYVLKNYTIFNVL